MQDNAAGSKTPRAITPGTVVRVWAPHLSPRGDAAYRALRDAGYDVRYISATHPKGKPTPLISCVRGAPEAAFIAQILSPEAPEAVALVELELRHTSFGPNNYDVDVND